MKVAQALELILTELHKAEEKHPGWPSDRMRQMLIIAEESGEAVRAQLNLVETAEKHARDAVRFRRSNEATLEMHQELRKLDDEIVHEVAQTGAMALRWLINHRSRYIAYQAEPGVEESPEATA